MKRLRAHYGCPVELALEFIGGKWKTVILAWLKEAPLRYGELRARMPGITDKVLTERLKDLEALDLVEKFALPIERGTSGRGAGERGAKAYRLTARGDSLRPTLNALYAWGEATARQLPVTIDRQGPHGAAQG